MMVMERHNKNISKRSAIFFGEELRFAQRAFELGARKSIFPVLKGGAGKGKPEPARLTRPSAGNGAMWYGSEKTHPRMLPQFAALEERDADTARERHETVSLPVEKSAESAVSLGRGERSFADPSRKSRKGRK